MIDLDDVGVEGQSEYGGFLSKEIPWPKSVFYGQKKFQDHDRQLLKRTWSSFHRLLNKQSKIQARAFPIPLQRSFLHSRPFKSMFFRWRQARTAQLLLTRSFALLCTPGSKVCVQFSLAWYLCTSMALTSLDFSVQTCTIYFFSNSQGSILTRPIFQSSWKCTLGSKL